MKCPYCKKEIHQYGRPMFVKMKNGKCTSGLNWSCDCRDWCLVSIPEYQEA